MSKNRAKGGYRGPSFTPPIPTPTVVPRFAVDDKAGYKFLEENGYVVFKDVVNNEEIETARSKAWDFLESLDPKIDRNNQKSWDSAKWPDPYGKGIVAGGGAGQSDFLWYCRGKPNVQKIFSTIWDSEDLITSYDGFCIHRPYEYNAKWKTKSATWYHLDQNGHHKPDRICVQGFLNLYDSGLNDGGLVVVPKSLTIFNSIFRTRPHLRKRADFIVFARDKSLWEYEIKKLGVEPIKVCAKAGDFVLWDSRTIHCNSPALTEREIPTDGTVLPPRRLVAYICMTPASRITPIIKTARIQAYKRGLTTSHWPEDCKSEARRMKGIPPTYKPIELAPEQKKLIPLK